VVKGVVDEAAAYILATTGGGVQLHLPEEQAVAGVVGEQSKGIDREPTGARGEVLSAMLRLKCFSSPLENQEWHEKKRRGGLTDMMPLGRGLSRTWT
jgi:hypothetical protein